METKRRWVVCAGVVAFSGALVLGKTDTALAQAGASLPVTTMPSMTAPAPTPTPDLPASTLVPAAEAPASVPATPERELEPATPGNAEPPLRFGQKGQIVLSGQLSASIGFLSYDQSSASSNTLSVEPAFLYFFADHLLVGGSLLMRYENGTSAFGFTSNTSTYGASLRFGVDVPLGSALSIEPVLGLGFWQAQTSFDEVASGSATSVGGTAVPVGADANQTAVFVSLYAPLLVHPAAHFFLGIGPDMYRDLVHTVDSAGTTVHPRRTFFGVSSVVGGWF